MPNYVYAYVPYGKLALCWRVENSNDKLICDGATVVNLCTIAGEFQDEIKLHLECADEKSFYLVVTENGQPVETLSEEVGKIELIAQGSGAEFGGFSEAQKGIYSVSAIPSGDYSIIMPGGWDTSGILASVADDGTGACHLDYYTVEVAADAHAEARVRDSSGKDVNKVERVLLGSELPISVKVEDGYRFDHWSAIGVSPEGWESGLSAQANQNIKVRGKVLLVAHTLPVEAQDDPIDDPIDEPFFDPFLFTAGRDEPVPAPTEDSNPNTGAFSAVPQGCVLTALVLVIGIGVAAAALFGSRKHSGR